MSRTVLHNARLVDPATGQEGPGALLLDGDVIDDVAWGAAPAAPEGAEGIDCGGLVLAPGFVDIGVTVGEPGARHLESFRTAGQAAAAGGVTTIVVQPDTAPPVDDPSVIEFMHRRAAESSVVRVAVIGALTRGLAGREMAEIGLMRDAGAVAFGDAHYPVADAQVFRRCLAYAKGEGALVVHHPQEPMLSRGVATESEFSGRLGLPGSPAIAERIMLERDLALLELTGGRLHIDTVTTRGALDALKRAREAGLAVTAGTSIHHLALNELDIEAYRTFFKFDPPLRAEADRAAVAGAIGDGLIDVIASGHRPWDEESKRVPFEAAAVGAVGLETLLPAALTLFHDGLIALPALVAALSLHPSRVLGLPGGRLTPGAPADLVLFDANAPWLLDRFALKAKSKNTPFDRRRMTGRVRGTWVAGRRVHPTEDTDR